jgi:hypothetical protein
LLRRIGRRNLSARRGEMSLEHTGADGMRSGEGGMEDEFRIRNEESGIRNNSKLEFGIQY